MVEPNMRIEISLSDDTLKKLARIFAPTPESLEEERVTTTAKGKAAAKQAAEALKVRNYPMEVKDSPTHDAMRQATSGKFNANSILDDLEEEAEAPTVDDQLKTLPPEIDSDQCGWIAGRLSKKLRINDKKNTRIGEPYWCQKDAGHKGKHIEGFPPVLLIDSIPDPAVAEQVDDHNQDDELEQADEIAEAIAEGVKTNPEGRTVVVKATEGVKGGDLVASLKGYVNKLNGEEKCGWWLPAGASYGKFCAATPGHSDSTIPGDHIWTNPAPQMVRA